MLRSSEEFLKYVVAQGYDPHFRQQYLACPFCEVNFTIYRWVCTCKH